MSRTADTGAGRGVFGWLRLLLAVAMLALGALMLLPPAWFGMGSISPEMLQVKLSGPNPPAVVDVRTGPEFAGGHIKGALPLPLHRLPFSGLALNRERDVVLICMSGHRSRVAGFFLKMSGFDHVVNLTGGMAAWRATGLPTAK